MRQLQQNLTGWTISTQWDLLYLTSSQWISPGPLWRFIVINLRAYQCIVLLTFRQYMYGNTTTPWHGFRLEICIWSGTVYEWKLKYIVKCISGWLPASWALRLPGGHKQNTTMLQCAYWYLQIISVPISPLCCWHVKPHGAPTCHG